MLKQLSIMGAFLLLPAWAPAFAELERADKALDQGQLAKARYLYKQVLELDPCSHEGQQGLAQADGDPAPYQQRCKGDGVEAAAAPTPAIDVPAPPAVNAAPVEEPAQDHRPASLKGGAAAEAEPVVAVGAAAEAGDGDGGANGLGQSAVDHRRRAELRRRQALEHPLLGRVLSLAFWLGLMGWGLALALLAGAVALVLRLLAQRRTAAPIEGGAAPNGPEEAAIAEAVVEPNFAPIPSAPAPQALPPEAAAAVAAPWASPLTPGEAVTARIDSARVQAGLTAHQFYFQGPRGVKAGWFRREERLTLAVPLAQVTGLAWGERGGERLIVGTALAGDVALQASDFGALALRQFAQQLSAALDRPLV